MVEIGPVVSEPIRYKQTDNQDKADKAKKKGFSDISTNEFERADLRNRWSNFENYFTNGKTKSLLSAIYLYILYKKKYNTYKNLGSVRKFNGQSRGHKLA